jgi:DNA-binding protein HU-beta
LNRAKKIKHEEGTKVNKADLVVAIADANKISKAAAHRLISTFLAAIRATLADRGKVTIAGFGTFSVVERSPRTGRNPKNGERIFIPARSVVRFKTGRHLDESVR